MNYAQNLKILFITTEDFALISHRMPLAKKLIESGHKVYLGANPSPEPRLSEITEILAKNSITFTPIKFSRGGTNPIHDMQTIRQIIKVIRQIKPDLIHAVAIKPCLYGGIAASITGVPILGAMGGMGFTFMAQSLKAHFLRLAIRRIFHKIYNHKNRKILVQNSDDYQEFVANIGLTREQVAILPGAGVDLSRFHWRESEPSCPPIRVVMMARLLKDKGVLDIIEAAKFLPKDKYQIKIYGTIDKQNPSSLSEEDVLAIKNQGFVQLMGHEKPEIAYQDAHIAILPSYREGMPMALMEAAAMGIPLIANDVAGCRDICRDGINGILVAKHDIQALANAIITLGNNQELRREFGLAGRKLCQEIFSDQIINQGTISLYQQLI